MTGTADEPREKLSGVIAMGLGLLVVVTAVLALTVLRSTGIDGEALLGERFELSELPFELEVLDAFRLPQGEEVVILGDPEAVRGPDAAALDAKLAELSPEEPTPQPAGDRDDGEDDAKFDWGVLPMGAELTPPIELAFIWYPPSQGEKILERQFGRLEFKDLSQVDWDGGTVVVDSGPLDWGDYTTHFVRERVLARDDGRPVFHDTARVNLTLGTRCCVLYMRWPRGMPGSKQRIREVLEWVSPRPE